MQDYIEFKDYLSLAHNIDIKKLISNEQTIFSEKVYKNLVWKQLLVKIGKIKFIME